MEKSVDCYRKALVVNTEQLYHFALEDHCLTYFASVMSVPVITLLVHVLLCTTGNIEIRMITTLEVHAVLKMGYK